MIANPQLVQADVDVDVDMVEWHSGDVAPRILSDFDAGVRSTNGYVGSGRCVNTLRSYGLGDGAVVALTFPQVTSSSMTSFIHTNSTSSRLHLPTSRSTGTLAGTTASANGIRVFSRI